MELPSREPTTRIAAAYTVLANVTFGMSFDNVTLTSGTTAGAQLGTYQHGNASITGMRISGPTGGAAFFSGGANDTVSNLSVDIAGGFG